MPNAEYPKSFVAIDFETMSGKRLFVCQVGMAKYIDGKLADTFSRLVCPPPGVPKSFKRIHGITLGMVKNEPTFDRLLPEMEAFVGDLPLVAHNARSFERACLRQLSEYYGFSTTLQYEDIIDTLAIARVVFPYQKNDLTTLCSRYSVAADNHHVAESDAVMCGEVYLHLIADHPHLIYADSALYAEADSHRHDDDYEEPTTVEKIIGVLLLCALYAGLLLLIGHILS